MRYLPSNTISDSFWAKLSPKIVALLKKSKIILSRSERCWKAPSQLKWLADNCKDDDGQPLFDDLPDEVYLSSGYEQRDRIALETLGLLVVDWADILKRVEADLKSPASKFKSSTTSESWHRRSADLLKLLFRDNPTAKWEIQVLELIPLVTGQWVASHSFFGVAKDIYYPHSAGVSIPIDLGLYLVDPLALGVASRKALFSLLGVRDCNPSHIIRMIIGRYNKWNEVSLSSSVAHLRYLYWNIPEDQESLDPSIYIVDQLKCPVYRKFITFGRSDLIVDDLYFESEEEYDAKKLSMPKFKVRFINREYLGAVPAEAHRMELSWKDWLQKFAEVRSIPRLVDPKDPTKLSKFFQHIVSNRTEKLIGILKVHWSSYNNLMNDDIVQALSTAKVSCENVEEIQICDSYLPLPELKQRSSSLGLSSVVPFLKLPTDLSQTVTDWTFLTLFHVGYDADLNFYLDMLRYSNPKARETKGIENLFAIYGEIERHSTVDDYAKVRLVRFWQLHCTIDCSQKGLQ